MSMPLWIARRTAPVAWRRIPWRKVWAVSLWLADKGRRRVTENLSEHEQREFWDLLKRSGGRPSSLSHRDKSRLKRLAGKAIRG